MSLVQRLVTSFRTSPESNQETIIADVFIAQNGTFEDHRDARVDIYFRSADHIDLTINGTYFPVFKKKNDQLVYSKPKYTRDEAFADPVFYALFGFSLFWNIQLLFDIEDLITISNAFLMVLLIGQGWREGRLRRSMVANIIFLNKHARSYQIVNLRNKPQRGLVQVQDRYLGFSAWHMFAALCCGFFLVYPLAFSNFLFVFDKISSYVAGGLFGLFVLGRLTIGKSRGEEIGESPPRIYGPSVIEAVFEKGDDTPTYHSYIGTLVNLQDKPIVLKDDSGEYIASAKAEYGVLVDFTDLSDKEILRVAKKYRNMIITGVREVITTSNVFDADQRTFETFLAEAYRTYELDKEGEFKVTTIDEAKQVLDQVETNTDVLKEIIDNFLKRAKGTAEIALRDILVLYDVSMRRLLNSNRYLVSEYKTFNEIGLARQEKIKNLTGALYYEMAVNSKPPTIQAPEDKSIMKYSGYAIGAIILLFAFVIYLQDIGLLSSS